MSGMNTNEVSGQCPCQEAECPNVVLCDALCGRVATQERPCAFGSPHRLCDEHAAMCDAETRAPEAA